MYFFDFWIIFFPLDDYFSSAIQAHSFISLEMGRNNGVLAQDSAPKPIQGAQVWRYKEVKRNKLLSTLDLDTDASQLNPRP